MKRKTYVAIVAAILVALVLTVRLFCSEPNRGEPNKKGPLRIDGRHSAFGQRIEEREEMVAQQIQARDVTDPNVLLAMRTVPRHFFVPVMELRYAYIDMPLPIGYGQTISQPYIVGFMTEAMNWNHTLTSLSTQIKWRRCSK